MAKDDTNSHADHLFREAYGEILASLTARFGIRLLDLIEDALQDTFIKAMQVWGFQGLPEKPKAWLYASARNRLMDLLRKEKRQAVLTRKGYPDEISSSGFDAHEQVEDAQLRMIFACCHTSLSRDYQLLLSLKLVAGFNNREVGRVLLKKEEAVAKAFTRAKKSLSTKLDDLEPVRMLALRNRSVVVHQVLYLMFTEGYRPQSGDSGLRKDLCFEALRLALLLDKNPAFKNSDLSALIALMAFLCARFDARFDQNGNLVDLENQDRNKYISELVTNGRIYWESCQREQPFASRYHLEAGIAFLHVSASEYSLTDWESILKLYDAHLSRQFSPIVALNRLVALAESGETEQAIEQAESLGLVHPMVLENPVYYALRGRIMQSRGFLKEAMEAYSQASVLSQNNLEKAHFERKIIGISREIDQVSDQPLR